MTKEKLQDLQRERIKEAIKRSGMTQKAVAKQSHISYQYLNNALCGKRNVTTGMIESIAKVLGINEKYLLGEKNAFATDDDETAYDKETYTELIDYLTHIGYDITLADDYETNAKGTALTISKDKLWGGGLQMTIMDFLNFELQLEAAIYAILDSSNRIYRAKTSLELEKLKKEHEELKKWKQSQEKADTEAPAPQTKTTTKKKGGKSNGKQT
ncbi:MAG: helix-turn-helix domain-containing protein [Lachnospiraceae bacterium]|jgi:transcriptional regulator with XRE-family HTH domain|nr:helix-turn-helix domain-containing protein [Lachnospiraceae bacterium]